MIPHEQHGTPSKERSPEGSRLSDRVRSLQPSMTLLITERARAMRGEGIDVIDLSVGEPDFPTPGTIKRAATAAIENDFTHYTAADGYPELKRAIIERIAADRGIRYEPESIIACSGAKHALANAVLALIDPGDEVLIPTPYWVSYPAMVSLAGGRPVPVRTTRDNGFLPTADSMHAAVTPRSRLFILNSPSNPTGAIYDPPTLRSVARIASEHDLMILSDEIYRNLVYDDAVCESIATIDPTARDRTVIVDGVSKSHAMTGWRIGYAAGPPEVIRAMARIQGHTTSNPCSISQAAAHEALTGSQEATEEMRRRFEARRNCLVKRLNALPGMECGRPGGAFYCFPDVSSLYGRCIHGREIGGSFDLARYLLDTAHVAVVPGAAFGDDRHIRLSYAVPRERIEEAMDRVARALPPLAAG